LQQGLPEPVAPASRQHVDDDGLPGAGLSLVAEAVGERKRVLDLGCGSGQLARALARRECDVVGFDINPKAVEEARKFCAHAGVADLDASSLDELLGDDRFDVVVLSDVLHRLRKPIALLDGAREMLLEGGYVLALVPNAAHGANRLALLDGSLDLSAEQAADGVLGFTAKGVDELFLSAGYRVDSIVRSDAPIFAEGGLVRSDFDAAVVAEVERDPESQTASFLVRALPLSNDAKHRAIAKRFFAANSQLATLSARIVRRDEEIERLAALASTRERDLEASRAKLAAAEAEMQRVRTALAELADASRSGASLIARTAEFESRALTAEGRYREVEARAAGLVERAHKAELQAARFGERLAVYGETGTAVRDAAAESRLQEALAEATRLRGALEAERAGIDEKLAAAKGEFAAVLAGLRRNAEETEYGYAEQVANLERERDALLEQVAQAKASDEAVKAAHQSRLHQLGTEIQGLNKALVESRERIGALDDRIDAMREQYDDVRAERDAEAAAVETLRAERDSLKEHLAREEQNIERLQEVAAAETSAAETLRGERDSLKDHLAREQQDVARLQEVAAVLRAERDGHRTAADAARDEADRAKIAIETLRSERDALSETLAEARAASDAAAAASAGLRDELDALGQTNVAVVSQLDESRAAVELARANLRTIADERDRLSANLDKARADFATIERERDELKSGLFASREALDEARANAREFASLLEIADSERAAAAAENSGYIGLLSVADAEIAQFEKRIAELSEARARERSEAAAELARLEQQLARVERQLAEASGAGEAALATSLELNQRLTALATERDRLLQVQAERQTQIAEAIETWKAAIDEANERSARLERDVEGLRKQNATLRTRVDEAAKRTGELERRYADQLRGAIDQTRAETERTALLIDTVQSSLFWKMKRWFSLGRGD